MSLHYLDFLLLLDYGSRWQSFNKSFHYYLHTNFLYIIERNTEWRGWKLSLFLTLFLERSGITFPGEGGSICPTYTQGSFSALETKRSKILFPHKFGSFSTDLSLFGNFFSTNHIKMRKIKILPKIAKKWVKFQNFAIFDLYQHIIHERKAFFM